MRSRAVSLFVPLAALVALAILGTVASADVLPAKTGTVAGKIMFSGKPLPGGTITFHPAKGKPIKVKIKADGSYEAKKVPVGKMRVTVETESLRLAGGKKPPAPPAPAPGGKYIPIPQKYASPKTSGLTLEVKEGKQTHNIELQ
jgi:hypothetical protein